jgi:cathepsin C
VYSPQDISSCSYYSQGCDGGFPYLVGRWAHDHGVSQDTTFPYQSGLGSTIPCSLKRNDLPNLAPLFVANYSYVGGYFGACSSAGMMESLLDNGPLAISFEVYPDFETFDFSNGAVYRHDYGIESQNPGGDERFRVTNHIVLIVGYGVAKDGTPYWEIMNSWGGNFGMGGMFRIARTPAGQTPTRPGGECAVEEMAVILNPQM